MVLTRSGAGVDTPGVKAPPTVRIGAWSYPVYFDEDGVMRFYEDHSNPLLQRYLVEREPGSLHYRIPYDLNRMGVDYAKNKAFSLREYLEAMIALGYSVSGLRELSTFRDLPFVTPLWRS